MTSLSLYLGLLQRGVAPAVNPAVNPVAYGRTANFDAGIEGDAFVDGINGSDGNDGLTAATAKATIAAGYDVVKTMNGARTLRIMGDGHRYREKLTLNLLNPWPPVSLTSLKIASYGTDLPFISGAETVTGFVPCDAADQAVVGSNYASIYKATFPTASIEHNNFWRLMLSENGAPLKLATLRNGASTFDPFFTDATEPMIQPSDDPTLTIGVNGSGYYDTITHSSTLTFYTDSQLAQTVAALHAVPNLGRHIPVTSVTGSVLTLASTTYRPESNGGYSLLNLLPLMEQGGWGYRDDGAGNLTLYVWPNDAASLANGIEIAVRKHALSISKNDMPLTLEGFGLEMVSFTETDYNSALLYLNQGDNIVCRQLVLDRCSAAQQHMIFFKFNENVTFERSTMRYGQGCYGVGNTDTGGTGVYNYRYRNLLSQDLSHTGYRCFGMRDSALVDCRSERTSAGGHANLINFYLGCDNVLVVNFSAGVGEQDRPWAGYATCQNSSRIYCFHSTFTMAEDTRAFVDQSVANATHPTDPSENYLVNCWVPHEPARLDGVTGSSGITVGETTPEMNWHVYNCITPRILSTGGTLTRKNNILTKEAAADPSEASVSNIDTLHVAAAARDWRAAGGGLLTTKQGFDVETLVSTLEAAFPDVALRRDGAGRPWVPADPGIGPYGKEWNISL